MTPAWAAIRPRSRPPAECLGEACQPPAAAPEAQTPASAAFRGPGNLRDARRGPLREARPARRQASPAAPASLRGAAQGARPRHAPARPRRAWPAAPRRLAHRARA